MNHLSQPLDLTVNRSAKSFFKRKFTEWYSNEITRLLDAGTNLDNIEVKLKLIVEYFNRMTSEGKQQPRPQGHVSLLKKTRRGWVSSSY